MLVITHNHYLAMKKLLSPLGALLFVSVSINAQIADWTFESSVPSGNPGAGVYLTNIAPEIGSGVASAFHAGPCIYTSPVGDGSAHSISGTNWGSGDFYQFVVSTTGATGIIVAWDQISSSTGPGKFELQYSTDGSSFTLFGSQYTVLVNASPNTWSSSVYSSASHYSQDLSSITALNNQPNVWFRLVDDSTTSAGGGTVGTGGTDRVDNFTVAVAVVPEPAGFALLGFGLATILISRRR